MITAATPILSVTMLALILIALGFFIAGFLAGMMFDARISHRVPRKQQANRQRKAVKDADQTILTWDQDEENGK